MQSDSFLSLVPDRSPHQVVGERVVILPGLSLEILTTRRIQLDRWVLKRLNDPYWRLYVPTSGEAEVWVGDKDEAAGDSISLKPGGAYLIAPRTTISSRDHGSFGKWYVHFTLGPGADRARRGVYPVAITETMRAGLGDLGRGDSVPWTSATVVVEALRQLPGEVWGRRRVDPRLERALEFMHANLSRKLVADEVALAAGLSVRGLNHLFRERMQTTPMRALLDFRLDKACRLLRHTADSIEQIAAESGFANRHYFSRLLKRHRGATPAAYRRGQW